MNSFTRLGLFFMATSIALPFWFIASIFAVGNSIMVVTWWALWTLGWIIYSFSMLRKDVLESKEKK